MKRYVVTLQIPLSLKVEISVFSDGYMSKDIEDVALEMYSTTQNFHDYVYDIVEGKARILAVEDA